MALTWMKCYWCCPDTRGLLSSRVAIFVKYVIYWWQARVLQMPSCQEHGRSRLNNFHCSRALGMRVRTVIAAAVEGIVDEAVARRLIAHVGAVPGVVYGKNGKEHIKQRVAGYNRAAHHEPWFVLVDLDHDAPCPPPMCRKWLPEKASLMCFCVAVRAVEAWLLADAEKIAAYLRVPCDHVLVDPEAIDNPKQVMVNLARKSRLGQIREDMVPRPGSARLVGPAYASRLIEFASVHWRPDVACIRSDNLRRAIRCLRTLAKAKPCASGGG